MTNIIFIKGSKQSILDFINRGLIGCNSQVRISADMSGDQIVDRLNGYGCPITMYSYLSTSAVSSGGGFNNAPLDIWKVKKETTEGLCLSFQVIDPLDYPVSFFRYINGIAGITVYAYGFDAILYPSWYQYDGRKDEVVWKNVKEDPKWEEYKETIKTQSDYNPNTVNAEAEYKVLEGYVQEFRKGLNEELEHIIDC